MRSWVDQLIQEYTIGKEELEKYRERLDVKEDSKDYEIIGSMISDMQFSLEWMKRGSKPGPSRGVERRSIYQRTVILDTELFPSLQLNPSEKELDDHEKRKLIDLLWMLSNRERQCYLLHAAYQLSYREIAEELNVSKRTVQVHMDRAKKKVEQFVS